MGAVGVLPSGTVTLLFSDIEGSTVLLSRLGAAYTDALDGQRRVLREAWAGHGGTELGTEGDSFFVVFSTAEAAVGAAVQAQRDLASFEWPAGEPVRVRMGIHTGTPQAHDGGYVGMDVHRAARIAGAAHGGQVVVSSATAGLVAGCLPDRVVLRDLGSQQLKDIAQSEHLFQLVVEGLPQEFPALRTLGAASRLPRPATRLVGRDGELSELTAMLSSSEVRLVTLTGPGGSGKTRLAIAVAHRLGPATPDEVYFVPLAAVSSPDAMWISIAENLDVPPGARTPPLLLAQVAHSRALLVLDNLEQLRGADRVVADLLDAAPSIRVLATSRRPLHLPGEFEHPVPPLELPESSDVEEASASGAVQMFVQQARLVRPGFAVTPDNAADVAAVCRGLDGLPLAIELAAARIKLLSPAALLARLDSALDFTASASTVSSRQKTLRDTIAWSYQLLDPAQEGVFRRLGVFAGGADLDAVTAVTADLVEAADPLELVGDLVDASLVTIGEDHTGEPRVGMLETIRAFALDRLAAAGELDLVRERHARYFESRAAWLQAQFDAGSSDRVLEARRQFEEEVDNYRAALGWALPPDARRVPSTRQVEVGLHLCAALGWSWWTWGHYTEAVQWLTRAVELDPKEDSPALGRCLRFLARFVLARGAYHAARDLASRSVTVCRRLDDNRELASALVQQARAERALGDTGSAQHHLDEALATARQVDDQAAYASGLVELARLAYQGGDLDRRVELEQAALAIYENLGDDFWAANIREDLAGSLRLLGRLGEADQHMRKVVHQTLQMGRAEPWLAEDYAALLADLGRHEVAARLIGAADAMRQRSGLPRLGDHQAEIEGALADARQALSPESWNREYQTGQSMTLEEALIEAHKTQDETT
jgi:predicted ATPase/class 3 adenylate cyclase